MTGVQTCALPILDTSGSTIKQTPIDKNGNPTGATESVVIGGNKPSSALGTLGTNIENAINNITGAVSGWFTPSDVSDKSGNIPTYGSQNLTAQQIADTVNAFGNDKQSISNFAKTYGLTDADIGNAVNNTQTSKPVTSQDTESSDYVAGLKNPSFWIPNGVTDILPLDNFFSGVSNLQNLIANPNTSTAN